MTTPTYTVKLSEQDLSDFLDDNQDWMEQYRAELEQRLGKYGEASVEISRNALRDKIIVNDDASDFDEDDEKAFVGEVMTRMANEMDYWLKQ
jgi:hypothetical protein